MGCKISYLFALKDNYTGVVGTTSLKIKENKSVIVGNVGKKKNAWKRKGDMCFYCISKQ